MSGEFTEKAELIPRIAFREIEDAEFVAELVRDYAATCADNLAQLEKLVIAGQMANQLTGKHLRLTIYKGEALATLSPEELRADALASLARSGEMLHAIASLMQEMRKNSIEATPAEDMEYDEILLTMAADIRRAVGQRKAEEN